MALSVRSIGGPPEDLVWAFNEHKLETIFRDDSVVHTTGNSRYIWNKRQRIGTGGYGTVWLQEMEGKQELRAVKMLDRNPHISTCQIQELLALVKLKEYPRLFVNFLGWYENREHIFLAMEYVKGGDLGGYVAAGGPKPIVEVKEITRQILYGLEVLHSLKIYHRDLKPQNILIACLDPIWVKIADFGVAKREINTSLRSQVGTYGYMAPEMLGHLPRRRTRNPAYALDMWSLGILVHEIVTFKTPFCTRETDPEPEPNPDSDSESDSSIYETAHGSAPRIFPLDEELLKKYCIGDQEFPTDFLERSQLDKKGIDFLKALLAATPKERLTATSALMSPWLEEPGLKNEFLLLGLDPEQGYWKGQITYELFPVPGKSSALSLLKESAKNGYNLAIEKLLEFGPINDHIIKESLLLAIKHLRYEATNTLLRRGHIKSHVDEEEVLHWALKMRHTEVIDILLGGGIFSKAPSYWEKLYRPVIRSGNLEILRTVIKRTDLNHITDYESPLKIAAHIGFTDTVKLLLDSGAKDSASALYHAIEGGHLGAVRHLLDHVEINQKLKIHCGMTYLESAVCFGHLETVKLLLERGANAKNNPEALASAVRGGHLEVVRLLLDSGADANNAPGGYIFTNLEWAAKGGNLEAVKLLLDSGADTGDRTLTFAARGGNLEVVRLLLDSGADAKDKPEALASAARGGHLKVVRLLLDSGADVNGKDRDGRKALFYAAKEGHSRVVELLWERSYDRTPGYDMLFSGPYRPSGWEIIYYTNERRVNSTLGPPILTLTRGPLPAASYDEI